MFFPLPLPLMLHHIADDAAAAPVVFVVVVVRTRRFPFLVVNGWMQQLLRQ
jgi:hypothetical protein